MSKYEHQDRDSAFNSAQTVVLDPGEQARLSYVLTDTRSTFFLAMVAASKQEESVYEIELDSTETYSGSIPPTDVDNAQQTFEPPESFDTGMVVRITNTSTDKTRRYHVQIKGFERPSTVDSGGL